MSDLGPLRRSFSLPHLDSRHDSGIGYSGSGSCNGIDQAVVYEHDIRQQLPGDLLIPLGGGLAAELKQLLTLRQHYYPEGNWGWLVMVAGFCVQALTHGLQLSYAVQLDVIARRFGRRTYESGKCFCFELFMMFSSIFLVSFFGC